MISPWRDTWNSMRFGIGFKRRRARHGSFSQGMEHRDRGGRPHPRARRRLIRWCAGAGRMFPGAGARPGMKPVISPANPVGRTIGLRRIRVPEFASADVARGAVKDRFGRVLRGFARKFAGHHITRWRSLGDSNPCLRRERALSWASRRREPCFGARGRSLVRVLGYYSGYSSFSFSFLIESPPSTERHRTAERTADHSPDGPRSRPGRLPAPGARDSWASRGTRPRRLCGRWLAP